MTGSIPIKDGASATDSMVVETGPNGFWHWSQPVVRGGAVTDSNQLPTRAPQSLRASGSIITPSAASTSQIVTGGSAQTLFLAGSLTSRFWVQNPTTATASLYVCAIGAASPSSLGSIEIAPGLLYESPFPVTSAISIYGATTGHFFAAGAYSPDMSPAPVPTPTPTPTSVVFSDGNAPGVTQMGLVDITAQSVTIQWKKPAGSVAGLAYVCQYRRLCDFAWNYSGPPFADITCQVINLSPNTAYVFRVKPNGGRFGLPFIAVTWPVDLTSPESPDGLLLAEPGAALYDAQGARYTVAQGQTVQAPAVNQSYYLGLNYVGDLTVPNLVNIYKINGQIYYVNKGQQWFGRSSAANSWAQVSDPRLGAPPAGVLPATYSSTSSPGSVFAWHGGAISNAMQVTLIYYGPNWQAAGHVPTQQAVTTAVQNLLAGPYYTALTEYGVFQKPQIVGSMNVATDPPATLTSPNDVVIMVETLLENGTLASPSVDNHLFFVILQNGVSMSGVGGAHGSLLYNGNIINYAFSLEYQEAAPQTALDARTAAIAHELAEQATDADITLVTLAGSGARGGWYGYAGSTGLPANQSGVEIEDFAKVGTYLNGVWVESFYSNLANSQIIPLSAPSTVPTGWPPADPAIPTTPPVALPPAAPPVYSSATAVSVPFSNGNGPGIPKLTIVAMTTTSITIAWSPPAGSNANLAYECQYKRWCDFTWTATGGIFTGRSITLTGLAPNTYYQIRVQPNGGRFNNPILAQTLPATATKETGDGYYLDKVTYSAGIEPTANLLLPPPRPTLPMYLSDAAGNTYSMFYGDGVTPYYAAINGVQDARITNVLNLYMIGHKIYCQTAKANWYYIDPNANPSLPASQFPWVPTADPRVGAPPPPQLPVAYAAIPSAQTVIGWHGGEVLNNLQVTIVYSGNWAGSSDPVQATVSTALHAAIAGPLFDGLNEYGIYTRPTIVGEVNVTTDLFSIKSSFEDLGTMLNKLFAAGTLTAPTVDNHLFLFLTVFPTEAYVGLRDGYHGEMYYQNNLIRYGFSIPNQGVGTSLNDKTISAAIGSMVAAMTCPEYFNAYSQQTDANNGSGDNGGWWGSGGNYSPGTAQGPLYPVDIGNFLPVQNYTQSATTTGWVVSGARANGYYSNMLGQIIVPIASPTIKLAWPVSAWPESADGTTIDLAGPLIIDSAANRYQLTTTQQILTNGLLETILANVVELYYHSHQLYAMLSGATWYTRTSSVAAWTTVANPINTAGFTASPSGTSVTTVGPSITDALGNVFKIGSSGYVQTNTRLETGFIAVSQLRYSGGMLYACDINSVNWYGRAAVAAPWQLQYSAPA